MVSGDETIHPFFSEFQAIDKHCEFPVCQCEKEMAYSVASMQICRISFSKLNVLSIQTIQHLHIHGIPFSFLAYNNKYAIFPLLFRCIWEPASEYVNVCVCVSRS